MSTSHELTEAGKTVLFCLNRCPIPRQEVNPGCARKLLEDGLVESVQMPTPYKKGWGHIEFLQLSEAGRALLRQGVL